MAARKIELRKLYDKTAGVYDRRYADIQRAKYNLVLKNLPEKVERILDLGCGTGLLLEDLSERGDLVVGIDASEKMLEAANARSTDAELVLADADYLPFKDASFDCVVSVTLLQNIPEPSACVVEATRVLKKGGLAVFTTLKRKHSLDEVKLWMESAGLKVARLEEIPESEDILCVARM